METNSTGATDPASDKLLTHSVTTKDNTEDMEVKSDDSLDFSSHPAASDAVTEEANKE